MVESLETRVTALGGWEVRNNRRGLEKGGRVGVRGTRNWCAILIGQRGPIQALCPFWVLMARRSQVAPPLFRFFPWGRKTLPTPPPPQTRRVQGHHGIKMRTVIPKEVAADEERLKEEIALQVNVLISDLARSALARGGFI